MKNSTINKLLYVAISFLLLMILFLVYKISTRPHFISTSESEPATITELSTQEQPQEADTSTEESVTSVAEISVQHGKTSSRANIRELPSTDARVLDTVEKDYTFEIIEILDNGWTKIRYNEAEAYISSEFVILVQN